MKIAAATPRLTKRACLATASSSCVASAGTWRRASRQYPPRNTTAATTGLKESRDERRKDELDQSSPPVTKISAAQQKHTNAASRRALRKTTDCKLSWFRKCGTTSVEIAEKLRRSYSANSAVSTVDVAFRRFERRGLLLQNELSAGKPALIELTMHVEVEPSWICDNPVHNVHWTHGYSVLH